MPGTESVKVIVRVRPLNSKEQDRGNYSIVQVHSSAHQISIQNPKTSEDKAFSFDAVYAPEASQQSIYDESAFPLVESVLEGYNGTIFAYGQTGCGKTYTMTGDISDPAKRGIIPNSFLHIFEAISEQSDSICYLVRCSYSEIYNEEIRDLLHYDPKVKLELRENKDKGVYVNGLTMNTVKSVHDIEYNMEYGNRYRVTKGTNMNDTSSRSHAIFTIYIETSETIDGQQRFKAGKLNLVDLAGSERQKKTGATGDRLKEGIQINLSLSALGNVISALVDGNVQHVPYRDSKLTRLLQDSLGGNTKTVMCAVVSPADYNYEESLSTLRYASRAKFIQNKPIVNEDPKDALLRQYAEEIARLKSLLSQNGDGGAPIVVEKIVEKFIEVPVHVHVPVEVPSQQKRRRRRRDQNQTPDDDKSGEDGPKLRRKHAENSGEAPVRKQKDPLRQSQDEKSPAISPASPDKPRKKRRARPALADAQIQFSDEDEASATTGSSRMQDNGREEKKRRRRQKEANPESDTNQLEKSRKRLKPPQQRQVLGHLESDSEEGEEPQSAQEAPKKRGKNQTIERSPDANGNGHRPARSKKQARGKQEVQVATINHDLISDLEEKERAIQEERDEKQKLEAILSELQQKLISGGEALDSVQQDNLKAQRKFRLQLRKKKQREQELLEEKQKHEEELLMRETQYQNVQEEVEQQRKVVKKLRNKYKQAMTEIKDLNREHEIEKESMLEAIRQKDRNLELYQNIFETLLDQKEFLRIKERSRYDEDNHVWHVPGFVVQNRTTLFPKLPKAQINEIIERDKKTRQMVPSGEEQFDDQELRNAKFGEWQNERVLSGQNERIPSEQSDRMKESDAFGSESEYSGYGGFTGNSNRKKVVKPIIAGHGFGYARNLGK